MKNKYRNITFLAELVINILVFSISCAILVGVFGQATLLARQTREETAAGTEVATVLETVRARGMEGLENPEIQPDGSYLLGYNKNWERASLDTAEFTVQLVVQPEEKSSGSLYQITAVAHNIKSDELCRFETAIYWAK